MKAKQKQTSPLPTVDTIKVEGSEVVYHDVLIRQESTKRDLKAAVVLRAKSDKANIKMGDSLFAEGIRAADFAPRPKGVDHPLRDQVRNLTAEALFNKRQMALYLSDASDLSDADKKAKRVVHGKLGHPMGAILLQMKKSEAIKANGGKGVPKAKARTTCEMHRDNVHAAVLFLQSTEGLKCDAVAAVAAGKLCLAELDKAAKVAAAERAKVAAKLAKDLKAA